MKILLGCDVDPALPRHLTRPPDADIWQCLENIARLLDAAHGDLPPITWLIRSDESVRFSTGRFDSGYLAQEPLWRSLAAGGHELGWHFHLMSYDAARGHFGFDADPSWLTAACDALRGHFTVRSTRTGWDYGSTALFRRLDALGIEVDFSALPGHIGWQWAGDDRLRVDWSRSPDVPYHPAIDDYQRAGTLRLLEVPIAHFRNTAVAMMKRAAWRLRNGSVSTAGMRHKTRMLTEPWNGLPAPGGQAWAFYFHPSDLHAKGIGHCLGNINKLKSLQGTEFVPASGML
jgi:hypothetical protein